MLLHSEDVQSFACQRLLLHTNPRQLCISIICHSNLIYRRSNIEIWCKASVGPYDLWSVSVFLVKRDILGIFGQVLFCGLSHWVVLSKRKGRRFYRSVLLASLRVEAHLPAKETTEDIWLKGGCKAGGLTLLLYILCVHMCVHMCICNTSIHFLQDWWISLAVWRGKGSRCLSGCSEDLEWRHSAHLYRGP